MSTKRQPTERQLAALAKAREALVKKHTCERCGDVDPARGLNRESPDRIYNVRRDGVVHRYCISCRIYYRWIDTRARVEQELHTLFAEQTPFYLIDAETTGKDARRCQIVEIAIVDQAGRLVYESLCKPDIPMPDEAYRVNGLTDDLLARAPTFQEIWPDLLQVLGETDVPIYSWNADFDLQALLTMAAKYRLLVPESISLVSRWRCAMKIHAKWYGEWSNGRNDYRWQSLEWACTELSIGEVHHRAASDSCNTLSVLRGIAERAGKYPPPDDMPHFDRPYYGD